MTDATELAQRLRDASPNPADPHWPLIRGTAVFIESQATLIESQAKRIADLERDLANYKAIAESYSIQLTQEMAMAEKRILHIAELERERDEARAQRTALFESNRRHALASDEVARDNAALTKRVAAMQRLWQTTPGAYVHIRTFDIAAYRSFLADWPEIDAQEPPLESLARQIMESKMIQMCGVCRDRHVQSSACGRSDCPKNLRPLINRLRSWPLEYGVLTPEFASEIADALDRVASGYVLGDAKLDPKAEL